MTTTENIRAIFASYHFENDLPGFNINEASLIPAYAIAPTAEIRDTLIRFNDLDNYMKYECREAHNYHRGNDLENPTFPDEDYKARCERMAVSIDKSVCKPKLYEGEWQVYFPCYDTPDNPYTEFEYVNPGARKLAKANFMGSLSTLKNPTSVSAYTADMFRYAYEALYNAPRCLSPLMSKHKLVGDEFEKHVKVYLDTDTYSKLYYTFAA